MAIEKDLMEEFVGSDKGFFDNLNPLIYNQKKSFKEKFFEWIDPSGEDFETYKGLEGREKRNFYKDFSDDRRTFHKYRDKYASWDEFDESPDNWDTWEGGTGVDQRKWMNTMYDYDEFGVRNKELDREGNVVSVGRFEDKESFMDWSEDEGKWITPDYQQEETVPDAPQGTGY